MLNATDARAWFSRPAALPILRSPRVAETLRLVVGLLAAVLVFGALLALQGKNPAAAYKDIFASDFGNWTGFSYVLVKMIPLLLCALAVAIPARVGLVNVGGEGQLYIGAIGATWVALNFDGLPGPALLPLMIAFAAGGAALWAGIAAVLRALGWLNETICTLLLNYVAIQIEYYVVFGPWKDPHSANYPQTRQFVPAAILPSFGSQPVHLGLIFGLVAAVVLWFVLRRTRWGYEMRAIGGNPQAARRAGIPLKRYLIIALMIGGAVAGLAGMGDVSAVQGRLRPDFSPGYGYIGFLISWLALHNPLGIIVMSFLLAVLTAGGDALQTNQNLPFASVNLLMALTLFMVLAQRTRRETER